MKTKITLVLLAMSIFVSCSNKDEYAYNEAAAADYYAVSNEFEECYTKFAEGKYQTKFEYSNNEYIEFSPTYTDVRNLRKNTTLTKTHFNLLKPSKKAQTFHNEVNEYFQIVGNDFVNAMQIYAELDCDCSEKKDSIKLEINNLYKNISTIENRCLEEQKKYIESIGGKAK